MQTGRSRTWLAVGVLVLNALMAGFATVLILDSRERTVQQVRTTTANLADLVRRNLTDYGVRIDARLQGVIDQIEYRGGVAAVRSQFDYQWLRKIEQQLPKDSLLLVVDAAGRPFLQPSRPSVSALDMGSQESFRRYRNDSGDALQVTPPVQEPKSGRWFVPCSRTLRNAEGMFAGEVAALIPIEHFEQLIAGIDAGPHGLLLLRDIDRGLIAFSRPVKGPATQIGSRKITPEAAALLDSGVEKAGYDAPMSPDGVPRTYAFHWSRPMSIVVGVGMAPQDYLTAWRREAQFGVFIVLLFFAITTVGAWAIKRAWDQLEVDIASSQSREERLRQSEQRLRDSEIRFRTLIEQSPIAI